MTNTKSIYLIRIPSSTTLLFLSFFEGASVMVAELAGGKMLAPFYGTSLYVWASTLSITLGGLTLGYYLGGEWSKFEKQIRIKRLFLVLSLASLLVLIMPISANFIMKQTIEMNFLLGLVLSQCFFLLPPILGMGMVSPLLISLIAETKTSGKAAGLIYAVSTLGGVFATLTTGFYLVPLIGIAVPCYIVGGGLFILTFAIINPFKKVVSSSVLLFLIGVFFFCQFQQVKKPKSFKVLYHSEGILGQIKVVDFTIQDPEIVNCRGIMVNHNWQTLVDNDNPRLSFLYYTRFTKAIISKLKPKSKVLLVGLGGGTVAKQLEEASIDYQVVEIDNRLPYLAEKYFNLEKAVANTTIDDGRHFINVHHQKYDLIIIDALLGENIPSHLLSLECFQKIKSLLSPNGYIFIEFDGAKKGEKPLAQEMLYNTISQAGLNCRLFTSVPKETYADIMYLASDDADYQYDNVSIVKDSGFPYEGSLATFEIKLPKNTNEILTDNNPALDYLMRNRMVSFRKESIGLLNKNLMNDHVAFFE